MRRTVVAAGLILAATLVPAGASAGSVAMFHRPIVAIGANQSSNWSGYNQGTIEQGGEQFHAVTGVWRVPTATQHAPNEAEYSSSWVGIGGGCVDANCDIGDTTLIQAGTEQDVDKSGVASYSAWWEIIPEPATTIPSLTVHAGDRMSVSISENPVGSEMWTIVVKDLTTKKSFTRSTPYSSSYATAEWIVETPVVIDNNGNVSIGPLPKLAVTNFDLATTNGAAPHLTPAEEIQLVDSNNHPLVLPSSPDPDTDGFNDCTFASTCKAPTRS